MGNLGAYQWITTTSKKVRGPINLLLLAGAIGAALYKGGEAVVRKCINTIKANTTTKTSIEAKRKLYKITSAGRSNEDLGFVIGDRFRVLESDGDSVLIEKIGDENNPYFVSAELLRVISDYKE